MRLTPAGRAPTMYATDGFPGKEANGKQTAATIWWQERWGRTSKDPPISFLTVHSARPAFFLRTHGRALSTVSITSAGEQSRLVVVRLVPVLGTALRSPGVKTAP